MARLILHVGGQKCGSSALQGYLFFNRFVLAKQGTLYVDRELGLDQGNCGSHNQMLPMLRNISPQDLGRRAHELARLAGNRDCIISSEGFCAVNKIDTHAARLAVLAAEFEAEIHIYVRNQINILYSGWHQWGIGQGLDFEAWVDHALGKGFADWNRILGAYERAIPAARFHVHVYDRRALLEGDIVTDFTSAADIPLLQTAVRANNPSINDVATQALLELSQASKIDIPAAIMKLKKGAPGWAVDKSGNFACGPGTSARIADHYRAANDDFLGRHGVAAEDQNIFHAPRMPPYVEMDMRQLGAIKHKLGAYLRVAG